MTSKQLCLFAASDHVAAQPALQERSSTFVDNMKLGVHRWFRYSAGFSAEWVKSEILKHSGPGNLRILDPFAGAGTTLLAAEEHGASAIGVEAHQFVARIARAKLTWHVDADAFLKAASRLRREASAHPTEPGDYPALIRKCFPEHSLAQLDSIKAAWLRRPVDDRTELLWLAITSILRPCSPVGTAQWQYVLPNKSKASALGPFDAFELQTQNMARDMRRRQASSTCPKAILHEGDARECRDIPDGWADLVITSPPYPNNYDYADATRLEMSFWGEVKSWGDLHGKVRTRLLRSCTQHVSGDRTDLEQLLEDRDLAPIINDLRPICLKLSEVRQQHGGKKAYHTMIAAYFCDLAKVWKALRRTTSPQCRVCFVIGDSAPYGVHVPVEAWLGALSLAAGFRSWSFEKTRDRNIKWKNRKHRVPLHEGRLWVES